MVMKGRHHIDNDTGDGIALAYRAGARLVDLEFSYGGTFSVMMKHLPFGNYNVALAHGARLINAMGDRFMERYDPVRKERSESVARRSGFREALQGRARPGLYRPATTAMTITGNRSCRSAARRRASSLKPHPQSTHDTAARSTNLGHVERHAQRAQNQLGGEATLPGLLGAGGCSKNEATGTHSSAGIPTAYAMNTGFIAGGVTADRRPRLRRAEGSIRCHRQLADHAMGPLRRAGNGWDSIAFTRIWPISKDRSSSTCI